MIIWGWGKKVINLGFAKLEHCPICEKQREFYISVIYSFFEIFWIPIISWGAKYYYHCSICDRGVEIDKNAVSSRVTKNPIPWFHRFGWLAITVPVVILVLVFGVFGVGSDGGSSYNPVITPRPVLVVTPPSVPVITPPLYTVPPPVYPIVPTLIPFQTPTPTIKPAIVLFQDDFSIEYNGWDTYSETQGSAFYSNGWLHIKANPYSGRSEMSYKDIQFSDFILQVETKFIGGSDDNWHLIGCRFLEGGNYYLFAISADGYFAISKWVYGQRYVLKEQSSSIHIKKGIGAINTVRVECFNSNLSLSVNGQLLAKVTDSSLRTGYIGLGADAAGSQYTEIAFDNIVINAP